MSDDYLTLQRIEAKLDTLLARFPEPRPRVGGFATVETEDQEREREARERGPLPHHPV